MNGPRGDRAVAVVGLACRFPGGAESPERFWELIRDGVDAVGPMPSGRFDPGPWLDPTPRKPGKMVTAEGGYLGDIASFDAAFFGVSPRQAKRMDPQHRLLLELTWEAMEDGGLTRALHTVSDVGVFVGLWTGEYENVLARNPAGTDFHSLTGTGRYSAAGRISYIFDFRGPSLTVDTACSGSLVALHLARQAILAGEVDSAIVGAANLILQPHINIGYSRSGILSVGGRCRFGDVDGTGYVRSEGAGVLVLKRLDAALADGDPIRGVILGSGVNSDGSASGHLARPSSVAQEELLRSVYRRAEIDPRTVPFIEAHGTGTRAGDPAELGALGRVLGSGRTDGVPLRVGSVKSNIGHTEAASGMAGLTKALLALEHGEFPRNLHLENPNPDIPWEALGVEVPTQSCSWPAGAARIVGVNSFGITGTNAHVIVGRGPDRERTEAVGEPRPRLIALSARSPEALRVRAQRLLEWVRVRGESLHLPDLEFTTWARQEPLEFRTSFVVESRHDLIEQLREFGAAYSPDDGRRVDRSESKRVGFVFSGQGSQWAGMGAELLARSAVFADTIRACDEAVAGRLERTISEILRDGSIESAGVEEIQPALVAFQIGLARQFEAWGLTADAVVGHSLGEVSAACIAGSLSLRDAMHIVCARSRLLKTIAGRGGMALVDLPEEAVAERIRPYGDRLSIAAVNGPRSLVVSGETEAVRTLVQAWEGEGVFARAIDVDVASHSPQVEPLLDDLRREVASVRAVPASIPFYSTSTSISASPPASDFAPDSEYWASNLRNPVRVDRAVEEMFESGVDLLIEVSPHPVLLSSLLDLCSTRPGSDAIGSLRRGESEVEAALTTIGRAFQLGADVEPSGLADPGGEFLRLPSYPWQREHHWIEDWDALSSGAVASARSGPVRDPGVADAPDDSEVYRVEWTKWTPPTFECGGSGRWLLLMSTDPDAFTRGVAESLIAKIRSDSGSVDRVTLGSHETPVSADEVSLAWKCRVRSYLESNRNAPPVGVVDLTATGFRGDPTRTLSPGFDRMCAAALGIAQGVLASGVVLEQGLSTVTVGSESPEGRAALVERAPQAAVRGLRSALWDEEPNLRWSCIDLDPADRPSEIAESLLRICSSDRPGRLALASNEVFRPELRSADPEAAVRSPYRWSPDGCYVVTGGLGEVGFHLATEMIRSGARHLLLLGRTPLPGPSHRSELEESDPLRIKMDRVLALEELGASIETRSVDLADPVALSSALDASLAPDRPPIRGVVHCAGALDRALVATTDGEGLIASLAAKAHGAWNLQMVLPEVETTWYTSSIIPVIPQTGQGAYAAANAVLDALSEARAAGGSPTFSMGWGVWAGTGMVRDGAVGRAADDLERAGLDPLDPERATSLFARWAGTTGHRVLARIDRERAGAYLAARQDGSMFRPFRPEESSVRADRPWVRELDSDSESLKGERLRDRIAHHLEEILGVRSTDLHRSRPLGQQGLDSLMAMELRRRLEVDFGARFPASIVWNHPTVKELAAHLLMESGAVDPTADESPSEPGSSSGWTDPFEDRSDEDLLEDLRRGEG